MVNVQRNDCIRCSEAGYGRLHRRVFSTGSFYSGCDRAARQQPRGVAAPSADLLKKMTCVLYGKSFTVVPSGHGRLRAHLSNDTLSFVASARVENGRTTRAVAGPLTRGEQETRSKFQNPCSVYWWFPRAANMHICRGNVISRQ